MTNKQLIFVIGERLPKKRKKFFRYMKIQCNINLGSGQIYMYPNNTKDIKAIADKAFTWGDLYSISGLETIEMNRKEYDVFPDNEIIDLRSRRYVSGQGYNQSKAIIVLSDDYLLESLEALLEDKKIDIAIYRQTMILE